MKKYNRIVQFGLIPGFIIVLFLHISSMQAKDIPAKRELLDSLISEIDKDL